jgi:hypothetical protein
VVFQRTAEKVFISWAVKKLLLAYCDLLTLTRFPGEVPAFLLINPIILSFNQIVFIVAEPWLKHTPLVQCANDPLANDSVHLRKQGPSLRLYASEHFRDIRQLSDRPVEGSRSVKVLLEEPKGLQGAVAKPGDRLVAVVSKSSWDLRLLILHSWWGRDWIGRIVFT